MLVLPESAAAKYEYKDETYYFCMSGCKDKFAAEPDKYLGSTDAKGLDESAINNPQSAIEFTCPMHPEIVQIGPGSCPKCGMALEPKEISLDDLPDTEYLDMKRRFWISATLTLPAFLLAMAEMLPSFHLYIPPRLSIWIQFILTTPVVLWGGFPFFQRAVASVKNISPNMFTLIATRAASIGFLPESLADKGPAIPTHFFDSVNFRAPLGHFTQTSPVDLTFPPYWRGT